MSAEELSREQLQRLSILMSGGRFDPGKRGITDGLGKKRPRDLYNLFSIVSLVHPADVIALCLKISPVDRPTPDQVFLSCITSLFLEFVPFKKTYSNITGRTTQLLNHPYFATLYQQQKSKVRWVIKPFLKCLFLNGDNKASNEIQGEHMASVALSLIYSHQTL